MKTTISTLLILVTIGAVAQSTKFEDAMKKAKAGLDTCTQEANFIKAANQFDRIAKAEKTQWLPYYWEGYCYIMISMMQPDATHIDAMLDVAENNVKIADSLNKDNSEIYVLYAWVYSSRIMVDPMNRGQKYGVLSNNSLQQAETLTSDNPRIFFFRGSSLLFTPEMYGGGKEKALPELEKAEKLFSSFKPISDIYPDWGKEENTKMLAKCKE